MKFYRLTVDSDNGFQAITDLTPKELLNKDLYAPYKFNSIDCIRLDLGKRKKKTDVLNMGTLSLEGFPIQKSLVQILNEFRLKDIQFVDIIGQDLGDYAFMFFNSDLTPKLDYGKSDLMFIKDFLGDIEELEINVPKDRNGAIKCYLKHAHDSTFNKMVPRNGYHFIPGFDINDWDVFRIGYFDKSFYVSEKVKSALEAAKATGLNFSESDRFNNPEPPKSPNKKPWWKF